MTGRMRIQLTDELIERMLVERAGLGAPRELASTIVERMATTRQHRQSWLRSLWLPHTDRGRLLLIGAILLLALVGVGIAVVGSGMLRQNRDLSVAPSPLPSSLIIAQPTPQDSVPSPADDLIAFSSLGRVEVIKADGTDRRQLSSGDPYDFWVHWSPDGRWLAFFSQPRPSQGCTDFATCVGKVAQASLVVMDGNGSGRRTLLEDVAHPMSFTWGPDSTWLAVTSNAGPGPTTSRVDVVDLSGSKVSITPPRPDAIRSPDGSALAYVRDGLRVAAPDGTHERLLVPARADRGYSITGWSPDGSQIAFRVDVSGLVAESEGLPHASSVTWLVGSDGRDPHPMAGLPEQGTLLSWSPDGRWMLVRVPGQGGDLANAGRHLEVAAADGSNPRVLDGSMVTDPQKGASFTTAVWSPDGRHLLAGTAAGLLVIDPSGATAPVVIEAPDGGGFDWQPGP